MCDREKAPLDSNVTGAPNLFKSPLSASTLNENTLNTTSEILCVRRFLKFLDAVKIILLQIPLNIPVATVAVAPPSNQPPPMLRPSAKQCDERKQ